MTGLISSIWQTISRWLAGCLTNCSLTTLQDLFNQTFGSQIDVTTDHDIVLDSLVLLISKSASTELFLHGTVSVDGHEAADAAITIGSGKISFEGSLTQGFSVGKVQILEPALAINIYTNKTSENGSGFDVEFTGGIIVAEEHHFDVGIYLSKTSEQSVEYAVYGRYDGDFYMHNLVPLLKETDFLCDVRMRELAVCVTNMDDPSRVIKATPPGYNIKRGLTIYAEVQVPVLEKVLGMGEGTQLVLCASYRPPTSGGDGSSFKMSIQIPNKNVVSILLQTQLRQYGEKEVS